MARSQPVRRGVPHRRARRAALRSDRRRYVHRARHAAAAGARRAARAGGAAGVTRAYAEVIGDPIVQSKSPAIHNFWLGKLGIDAEYRAAHVRAVDLAEYLHDRRADEAWRGCNVTMP